MRDKEPFLPELLVARFGLTAEAQVLSVIQRHQNLGHIFAGSNV
jgi:hypothetical protein